jgi:hypothetical protein
VVISGSPVGAAATGSPAAGAGAASTGATSPSGTSKASPSPSGAWTGAAPCPSRYLAVKAGIAQGTAGSVYQVIDFTNISKVTCSIDGYPGVSLAGGTPVTQIGLAATRSTVTPAKLVILKPGAVANALLQITDALNYPTATCGPVKADYLIIYPPNQTTPIPLAYTATACSKPVHILSVTVVQLGSGG